MPFTLAHTAVVIPLVRRKGISFTALMAGSIAPDMEFYLRLRETDNFGHSLLGALVLDIPLAIAICMIFHVLVRDVLYNNVPHFFRARTKRYLGTDYISYARRYPMQIITSVILGLVTHFMLDQFTHGSGYFISDMAFLSGNISVLGNSIPFHSILQLLLSLLGTGVVIALFINLPQETSCSAQSNKYFWKVFFGSALTLFLIRLIVLSEYDGFWDVFIASVGCPIYALLITSLLFKKRIRYE